MSSRMIAGFALAFVVLVIAGCTNRPGRVYPPDYSSSAGADAIAAFDTNKDGKISGAELDKCPGVKAALARLDPSGKGEVTADMITARIQAWKDSRTGRTSFSCSVTQNGRPLVGADVKLVPEKFLGDYVKTAVGKTDQNGMAMISIPGITPPGIAPGLYRVEITKSGVNIPAKYNKDTILGVEIAQDAAELQEGVRFDLKF